LTFYLILPHSPDLKKGWNKFQHSILKTKMSKKRGGQPTKSQPALFSSN